MGNGDNGMKDNLIVIIIAVMVSFFVTNINANVFTDVVKGHYEDIKSRFADDMIQEGDVLRHGTFNEDARGSDSFHNGSGAVTVRTANGERFVQLESDFDSTPGPDYYVYASSTQNIQTIEDFENAENVTELGKLTKGSGASFYNIANDDVYAASITIICKRFHVFITSADMIIGVK